MVQSYDAIVHGWVMALDLRDHETEGHSERVAALTVQIASQMGFDDQALTHLYRGALLHDHGRLAVCTDSVFGQAQVQAAERSLSARWFSLSRASCGNARRFTQADLHAGRDEQGRLACAICVADQAAAGGPHLPGRRGSRSPV